MIPGSGFGPEFPVLKSDDVPLKHRHYGTILRAFDSKQSKRFPHWYITRFLPIITYFSPEPSILTRIRVVQVVDYCPNSAPPGVEVAVQIGPGGPLRWPLVCGGGGRFNNNGAAEEHIFRSHHMNVAQHRIRFPPPYALFISIFLSIFISAHFLFRVIE